MLKTQEAIGYLQTMDKNVETPVIVVTGMHRSGTSLVASLLQSAGINIGQRLMDAGEGNIKGHFEDLDLVDFHESILKSQGFSKQGWILQNCVRVQEQYLSKTQEIIRTRQGQIWGWKDPRTTLFLDFWREQIPSIFYIFVFRSPWEVIDSLYRRGDEVFLTNPNFALDVWVNYNKIILDFYQKNSSYCCLFNIESIIKSPEILIKSLANKLSMELANPEYFYDEFLFNRELKNSHRPTIIKNYFPEAWKVYEKLCCINGKNEYFDQFNCPIAFDSIPDVKFWILQDWIDTKVRQKGLEKLAENITDLKLEIAEVKEQLEKEKAKNRQLQNTIAEKGYIINQMKESRFWKLRDFSLKIRRRLIPF
jgi:hypothetical protein